MHNHAFAFPRSSEVPETINWNCKPKLSEFPQSTTTKTINSMHIGFTTNRLDYTWVHSMSLACLPAHNSCLDYSLAHKIWLDFPPGPQLMSGFLLGLLAYRTKRNRLNPTALCRHMQQINNNQKVHVIIQIYQSNRSLQHKNILYIRIHDTT